MADPAETHWHSDIGNRNVKITGADRSAAETAYVKAHGHAPATAAERADLHTMAQDVAQNKFNSAIDQAVTNHPIVSAPVLKALLYQESNMNAAEGGRTYVGIAQLGASEARGAGLRVDATVDERHDATKSIGAAAATLAEKNREMHGAYTKYGQPAGDELAKFTTAAYNGGAGTIGRAMHLAHDAGLAQATKQGLTGDQAKAFADSYATKFDNLTEPRNQPEQSPLYKSADHYLSPLGADPHEKYNEIRHYADDIVARANQNGARAQTIAPVAPAAPGTPVTPPAAAVAPQPPAATVVPPARASDNLSGFKIHGESIDGRRTETRVEIEDKNHLLDKAIVDAKAGKIDAVAFATNGHIGEKALAAQNEILHRAILTNLPEPMQADYAKTMHLDPGPRITGEVIEGKPVESAAVLEAKNAKIQTSIALAHQGWVDHADFKPVGQESAAEVKRQNDVLHDAIAKNLPAPMREAYLKSLEAPSIAPVAPASPVQAGPAAPSQPSVPPANGVGAYDRTTVEREVGKVALAPNSSDLTDPAKTKRAIVDALGNLEAHAGVPLTVSVINTGHHSDAVDNVNTHGHKGGYAADLYVDRNHDSAANRLKLVEAIANDPYVTKVGLGGDYKSAEYTRILEHAGKTVFPDNDQSHIHIQAEPNLQKLEAEERGDATPRSGAPVPHTNGTPAPTASSAPAKPVVDASLAAFERDWKANGVVNPRSGETQLPALSATLDQKTSKVELSFKDQRGTLHSATMGVGEASVGRTEASQILPGKYQLGSFQISPTGSISHAGSPNANAFGKGDIPITMRDGADHVPVVLNSGRVSNGNISPSNDARSDATNVRLQGGGSSLGSHAQDAQQPLTPTRGSVRGENADVEVVARIIQENGKPIPLTVTREARQPDKPVELSNDGGKSWSPASAARSVSGTLLATNDPNTVEVVTRGGTPPSTVAFKTEQLGLTKDQVADIASRDPKGVVSIGVDQFSQPVVQAKVDMDRTPVLQREVVSAGR